MKEKEEEYQKHESFGQIHFSRSHGHAKFYGSELEQDHYITMEVKQSEVRHDMTRDWYFANGLPLMKVRMTSGQFAEMITSLNRGDGIPCTIEMVDGKPRAELPAQESRKEYVHRKFKDRMDAFAKTIRERQLKAKELVKKKTLSKQDIHELNMHLEWLTNEVSNNIPFFMECFQETMDKVVFEAKTEVENAIQHKISTLGLEELQKKNQLLSGDGK